MTDTKSESRWQYICIVNCIITVVKTDTKSDCSFALYIHCKLRLHFKGTSINSTLKFNVYLFSWSSLAKKIKKEKVVLITASLGRSSVVKTIFGKRICLYFCCV